MWDLILGGNNQIGIGGPNFTNETIIDNDLYGLMDGGICNDGSQTSKIRSQCPSLSKISPIIVKPGVYRHQIARFKFKRPASLHAILRLNELAKNFDMLNTDFYGTDSKKGVESQAFFINKIERIKKQIIVDPILDDLLVNRTLAYNLSFRKSGKF